MTLTFEITDNIGILSYSTNGWSKQINVVSWNGRDPKYDIRDWDADREKMGRGISLSQEELSQLRNLINALDLDANE